MLSDAFSVTLTCPFISPLLSPRHESVKSAHLSRIASLKLCRELTTLWVARLDDGAELKVTDPKEQQRDVEEEEAKG